jgi:hypothetical protein
MNKELYDRKVEFDEINSFMRQTNELKELLNVRVQLVVQQRITNSTSLDNDWKTMTVLLHECQYLNIDTVLRIQRYFFIKWLTISPFNKNAASKLVNFVHSSPIIEIIMNKITFWLD